MYALLDALYGWLTSATLCYDNLAMYAIVKVSVPIIL